jgi:excinuclease UvrABC helicase subunit UvrB
VAEVLESYQDEMNLEELLKALEREMSEAAEALDYERAATLRDEIFEIRDRLSGKGTARAGPRQRR